MDDEHVFFSSFNLTATGGAAAPEAAPVVDHPIAYVASLIGPVSLRRARRGGVVQLPRRGRALLAYLLLASDEPVPRERLAGLLWSDRADAQARGSLRQLLFDIRDLAGDDGPVVATRLDVGLRAGSIVTDVQQLRRAATAGDVATLLDAADGWSRPILDDLDSLGESFDEWLTMQRERVREERRALVLRVCAEEAHGNRHVNAYRLARMLLAIDPLDEVAAAAAIAAARANDDPATAQRLFADLEARLRAELGIAPSASTHRALNIPAAPSAAPLDVANPPVSTEVRTDRKRKLLARARVPAAAAAIAFTAGALAIGLVAHQRAGDAVSSVVAIVSVKPLTVASNDPAARTVRSGLAAVIARDLIGTGTPVQVVDGGFANPEQPAFTVRGSAVSSDGFLHATVELIAGTERTVSWSGRFTRPTGEVDGMVEQVGLQVARELHCAYQSGRGALIARDPELARLALAACDAVGRDFDEAARFSAQAVARNPTFARGWSELAAAVAVADLALPPAAQAASDARAAAYARRAIALDPHQGLAYFALATTMRGTGSWRRREAVVAKGLRLDPDNGEINNVHAADLTQIGRLQDALGFLRRSYALDHFLPGKLVALASLEADLGETDQAAALLAIGRTQWPHHPWLDELAYRLALDGRDPQTVIRLLGAGLVPAHQAHAASDRAFARWRAQPTRATNASAAQAIRAAAATGGASVEQVEQLAMLGRNDAAFALADQLPPWVNGGGSWFRDELSGFRADPRFTELADRLGLAAIWRSTGLDPDFAARGT